jgi:uncharacterized protein (TIGR02246 family)
MKMLIFLVTFVVVLDIGCAIPARADQAADKAAVTERLLQWAAAFNARDAAGTCDLFAPDLISTVPGGLNDDRNTVCARLAAVLAKTDTQCRYTPDIREIIVSGDYAVVRLIWSLTMTRGGQEQTDKEAGMDLFQRQADGRWSIARFVAFSTSLGK